MRARKIALSKGAGTQLVGKSAGSDIAEREAYAKQLMQHSLSPSVPEQSWTQGAARTLEGLGAALERHRISDSQACTAQQRSNDIQLLSAALSGKADLSDTLSKIQSPDIQKEMLNLIEREREYKQHRSDKQDDAKQAASLNPINVAQTKLAQTEDIRDNLSAAYAKEQDPEKKAKLEALLSRANETVSAYKDRIMSAEGKTPNMKQQFENQYLQNLAQNGPPGAAEKAAFKSSAKTPEDALQKTIGEGMGKNINAQLSKIQEESQFSSTARAQGETILQDLAANPDIMSGPSTAKATQVKAALKAWLPGLFAGLGDQENFQKGLGGLLVTNIGKLRSNGVQRITESEIQNVLPTFTPTLLNSTAGIKKILELQAAMDPAIQKGNSAISALLQKYQSDPGSIPDIQGAIKEVEEATQKEVQAASMNYMNAGMAKEGKKMTINPSYDPVSNPINKYVVVPIQNPDVPAGQGGAQNQSPQLPTDPAGQGQPQNQGMPMQPPTQNAPQPTTQAPPQMPPQQAQPQAEQPAQIQPRAEPQQMPQQAPAPPVDPRAAQSIAMQAQGMSAQPTTNNVPMTQQPSQAMAMQLSNPSVPDSGQPIDPRKAALIQALMAAQNGQGVGQ